jgi:S1-C subfamily serine protease
MGCSASRCKSGARASLPASAAEFAGLQRADLITPIAGPCISTPRIHQTLATVGAAQTVKLKIQRGRKPMELSITAADL